MPHPHKPNACLLSREECDASLPTGCINAMSAHRLSDKSGYFVEIDSLSKVCDYLITHYDESMHSVITRMEKIMTEAHNNEVKEIDKKIQHLFKIRKGIPCNTFYCEQEIIKLTTEIHLLEELKLLPFKDTVQGIIFESLEKAIKTLGTDPGDFNLTQYEYHPVLTQSDSEASSQTNSPNSGSTKRL